MNESGCPEPLVPHWFPINELLRSYLYVAITYIIDTTYTNIDTYITYLYNRQVVLEEKHE